MSLLRRRMMMASNNEASYIVDELDYLTIIPLHEEEESYHIRVCQGNLFTSPYSTQLAPLYYRINNGEWVEVMLPDLDIMYFYINLKKGDELQLKCTTYNLNVDDYDEFRYVSLLDNNSAKFNVRGTPMSLIYGDYFKENNIVIEKAFYELFYCSEGLTEILNPKTFLPYTVLESHCYDSMFYGCTNLVNAPELPATTLAESCYYDMFRGCTKLNYIKMLAIDISATDCLYCWTYRVSSTGTFVKNPDATWDIRGKDGIPEDWTVVNDGEEISFTIVEGIFNTIEVEYNAIEGMTWAEWVDSEYNTGGYYIYEKNVLTPDHISVAHSDTGIGVLTDEVIISKKYVWN